MDFWILCLLFHLVFFRFLFFIIFLFILLSFIFWSSVLLIYLLGPNVCYNILYVWWLMNEFKNLLFRVFVFYSLSIPLFSFVKTLEFFEKTSGKTCKLVMLLYLLKDHFISDPVNYGNLFFLVFCWCER